MRKRQRLRRYLNIRDMHHNPAFAMQRIDSVSKVAHFFNYIGDRCSTWRHNHKYICEICHVPIQKRGKRKLLVCQRCLHKYLYEVKVGVRVAKPYVEVYAR